MKILVVDDETEIQEVIEFSFTSEIKCDIVLAASGNEAIEKLKQYDDIDMVVCDYNMPQGNGGNVYTYMMESNHEALFVFCSSDTIEQHAEFTDLDRIFARISKSDIYQGVQQVIAKYNERQSTERKLEKNHSACISVGLELLKKTKTLPCNIYIELKNGKKLKIFNQGDTFTAEEYNKYAAKGIKYLLIERKNRDAYVESLCGSIHDILIDKDLEAGDKVFDAHSSILTVVKELGLSESLVKLTQRAVNEAISLFDDNPAFNKLEKKIFKNPENYLTAHSIALAYISSAILSKTAWSNLETRKKLVMASFLHDASIRVVDGVDQTRVLKEDDYLNFREHPIEAQTLLKKFKNIPPDLDRIILEHHEKPNGTGFPRQLDGTQVHPLTAIFILAHDIVDLVLQLREDNQPITDEALHEVLSMADYSIGSFKKCYDAFLQVKIFE